MKIKKENVSWIFVTVLLLGLLALSFYLGLSGWYFHTEDNYSTDFQLGKTMQISTKENEANAISLNLEGAYLPNEHLPQVIAVQNASADNSIFLRAKVFIYSGTNISSPLTVDQTANWMFREEDGYYYYNDYLSPQNKATLCSHILTPNDVLLQTSKKYVVTFVFESLTENQDVISIWGFNPIAQT